MPPAAAGSLSSCFRRPAPAHGIREGDSHTDGRGCHASSGPRSCLLILALLAGALAACSGGTPGGDPAAAPETAIPAGTESPSPSPTGSAEKALPTTRGLPSLREVVDTVSPAVVAIDTNSVGIDFFLRPIEQTGSGSGVIMRPDGYIVTNAHVVQDAQDITVALPDGRVYPATVLGQDPAIDLAVLKIDETNLPAVEFAEAQSANVGDWAIALGNALDLEGNPTVTIGIVSAVDRSVRTQSGFTLSDLIQTDAAINEGNSGGPLVNLDGQLIGLNTTIFSRAEGIGFSINADTVKRFANDLIEHGRVRRPFIGLSGKTLTGDQIDGMGLSIRTGILVSEVMDGPGRKAGIQTGDVILEIAGRRASSWREFLGYLFNHRPQDTVDIELIREGERVLIPVTLEERS